MQIRSFLRILGPSLAVLCMIKTATALKADGEACTLSSECSGACCTKKFSPGYPTNGTWQCNTSVKTSTEPSCQGIPYKEYEVCDYSSQCESKCCRIDDNASASPRVQKCQYLIEGTCLPDPVVAVQEPSNPQILLQGDYCSTSNQCVDGCCRANANNDNKLACLAATNSSTVCVKSTTLFADYEFCSQSFMCKSGCCANNLSDDKKYKCWPKDGGANCMDIPAAQSNKNSTSDAHSMMPSSSTVLLSAAFCLSLHGACQLLARAGFLGSK